MCRRAWSAALSTSKVKSIRQTELGVAGGVTTTGAPVGVNVTWPVAWSMGVMVKVCPAQAVPASPRAVALSANTPGSAEAAGQSPLPTNEVVPQDGTRSIAVMVTLSALSGGVDALRIWREAGRLVWPTVTLDGKVGVTPKPTPAKAAGAAASAARTTPVLASARRRRIRVRPPAAAPPAPPAVAARDA